MSKQQPIAIFDFDNTITSCDSLLPFLFFVKGRVKTVFKLLLLSPYFFSYLLRFLSRQAIKEKILTSFFHNMSFDHLKKLGKKYDLEKLDSLVRPKAIERLRWHQQQGHRCILISASPNIYLSYWTQRHAFDDLICSQLEVASNGLVTGKLMGINCWGSEKKRLLMEHLEIANRELYVYGDSKGDLELLQMAHHPHYRFF